MNKRNIARYALSIILSMLFVSAALAEGAKAIAVILTVKGNTEIKKADNPWNAAKFGTVIDDGDQIRTGEDGFIAVVFTDDKSQLKIRPNTILTLNGEREEDFSIAKRVNMEIGELFADVAQQKGSLQVATPTSVASVKGTEFWVIVEINGTTQVLTLQGLVELLNLSSGYTVDISAGTQGLTGTDGTIEVEDIDEETLPEFLEEELQLKNIEIRFLDENGQEKTLIIQYQDNTDQE